MDDDHEIDDNDDDGEVQGKGDGCHPPKCQALQPESNDIASYVGHSQSRPLSSVIKFNLLQNHFTPGANYSFPKTTNVTVHRKTDHFPQKLKFELLLIVNTSIFAECNGS